MKSNSNHIVIIHLHCLERQKILTASNISKTTKKILGYYGKPLKGQLITIAKEISNYFNNFFTSVAKK